MAAKLHAAATTTTGWLTNMHNDLCVVRLHVNNGSTQPNLTHANSNWTIYRGTANKDRGVLVGIVELCAKKLQIMRNDFKDYALFANYAHLFRFCITHSLIQERQNSLPPSSKTLDFLYCLARSAALTLAEWSLLLSGFSNTYPLMKCFEECRC